MTVTKTPLKVSDLKKILFEKVNTLFTDNNFKSNKGQMKFIKQTKTATIEVLFDFSSFFPSHCEYHFKCFVYLKELDVIINEYQRFIQDKQKIYFNVLIVEGEFIKEMIMKDRKFSKIYVNQVDTLQNAELSIAQTLNILKSDALPKAQNLSSLNGFREFFFDHPERIAGRITDNFFILSCLMAAYTADKNLYFLTSDLIYQELEKSKKAGLDLPSSYSVLDKMRSFVEYKSKI